MRPILFSFRIGGRLVELPSYGLLVAVGFAAGIVWFVRAGRRRGFDGQRLQDLAFRSVVLGLIGARLTFVLLNARAFIDACKTPPSLDNFAASRFIGCTAALRFWDGGFVFYGGAAAVAIVVWVFCRRERWSFLALGDLAAPAVALGHGIGRLGCLLAGCCYGKVCTLPWAVSFRAGSVAFDEQLASSQLPLDARFTQPLHPTQVYEAVAELVVAAILWRLQRRQWRAEPARLPPPPPGGILTIYVASYALIRFVVELFRGDAVRGFVVRLDTPALSAALGLPPHEPALLSTAQVISLLALVAAVVLALVRRHRSQGRSDTPNEGPA